ncbi:class II aldolase/adducin family protein [Succiniclasticum ruminis]|uniref:Ribulose-5-phosphate 4-epimerase/Fuculose-1-phosphate aldolase n=1 Tax=Succiniclasticum ruminis DSM 9236 TaxID=1123323 RepID=A0A1I2CJT8_9FIRM|nr:class II aldolase/adducin family protein [Succiniclasticum ruminis]SFE68607.1 Ribulose-5-phosphate 4-epimerase/Fuculose-1-phosphate aldolase [Succiniclasticum ruminis DSM 9236]
MNTLLEKLETACWIARTLFMKNRASGSSANMSFLHNGRIVITKSGSCFGCLKPEDFSEVSFDGKLLKGEKPSKEFPLHQMLYKKSPDIGAVIHTHCTYSVLWSCLHHENEEDVMPGHTPYLKMKVGTVGLIPFAAPGSQELFRLFAERIEKSDAFLLAHHGPVVGGKDLMNAFYGLEELEDSATIAWNLYLLHK